ncbi:hypothetical protein LCGC14_1388730 [marine sediment metagenome]|uniref:ERCC4 domain-containing protein n=1 Tax=marine sediment metagenome TaxID=412755 RepID=A0A0F9K0L9_9ZZZZ
MRILKKRRRSRPAEKWPIPIYWDDREKKGRWHLDCVKYKMVKCRIDTGDYVLYRGKESIVIERKASMEELISNLTGQKKYKFYKFLERLSGYKRKCIVVEDTCCVAAALRRNPYARVTPKDIYFQIGKIMFEYGIPILFCNAKGQDKQDFLYYLFDSAWQAK